MRSATAAAIGPLPTWRSASPAAVIPVPKASASVGRSRPAGSGRLRVRSMSASVRRSMTMLRALAPAATSPVPARAIAMGRRATDPGDATTNPTQAVSTTIRVIRGFVSSRKSAAAARRGRTTEALT